MVLDKGYHSAETLETFAEKTPYRVYASVPSLPPGRLHTWTDKPATQKQAVYANNRRARGTRGRRLQRQRSEKVERSFAHVCETGGARRTWLRGMDKVAKRYLMAAAAHNLGRLMRALFGMGTPRGLQQFVDLAAALGAVCFAWINGIASQKTILAPRRSHCEFHLACPANGHGRRACRQSSVKNQISTGC